MDFPKKQQQNLIPRYLLQYLTSLEYHHTDPTAPWGGGGGGTYTAGDGIEISDEDVISIDDTVALKTDLSDYVTSTDLSAELLNYAELSDLATVATTGDYNDLINKPTIPVVPTNVSAFTNDAGYITSSYLSNYVTLNGTQTISGAKKFTGNSTFQGTNYNVFFNQTYAISLTDKNNPNQTSMNITPYSISSYRDEGYTSTDGKFYLGNHYFSAYNSDTEYKIKLVSKGGATTYGEYTFKNKTGDVAITSEIPTATSDLTNDSGYITSSALTGYATETWVTNQGYSTFSGSYNDLTDKPTIPTDTSDLTNGAGYITSSDLTGYATETWVTNQGYSTFSGSYNDLTNKPTIPSVSGVTSYYDALYWSTITINNTTANIPSPSNFVTIASNQDITGNKTFLGNKTLNFKQSSSSDVIGFTAYDNSNYEVGNLQIANRTVGGTSYKYVTLGNYSTQSTKSKLGFRVQPNSSSNSFNFVMPYGTNAKFTANGYTTTADTTFPFAFTDGTTTIKANATGLVDLSTLSLGSTYTAGTGIDITSNAISIDNTVALKSEIPTVPTNVSAFTNDAGYITRITSSDVTTALGYTPGTSNFSGSYNDLSNKPTIPDAVSGTNDGTNWTSLTIGSDTYDIPAGGSSGPTITKYNTSSYMTFGSWSGSKTCDIVNRNTNSNFTLNNTNPGDILFFDIILTYNAAGFARTQRHIMKLVVPAKSTNTSYYSSHLDLAKSYEIFNTNSSTFSGNTITLTIENITDSSQSGAQIGELVVPQYLGTSGSGSISVNSIIHIAF